MGHETRARREYGEIAAALLHQLELVVGDGVAQLVVGDFQLARPGLDGGVLDSGDLPVAPVLELFRRRRVMAVYVDDHQISPWVVEGGDRLRASSCLLFCRGERGFRRPVRARQQAGDRSLHWLSARALWGEGSTLARRRRSRQRPPPITAIPTRHGLQAKAMLKRISAAAARGPVRSTAAWCAGSGASAACGPK